MRSPESTLTIPAAILHQVVAERCSAWPAAVLTEKGR